MVVLVSARVASCAGSRARGQRGGDPPSRSRSRAPARVHYVASRSADDVMMRRTSSLARSSASDARDVATERNGSSSAGLEFGGLVGTEWFSRKFSESGRKFSEVFPVRYAEAGPNGEATMVTIADLIQECACNHAQGIWGVGQSMPAEMAKGHLAWVCTRLHLRVNRYPKWGGKVNVSTWFEPMGKIAARRDYAIHDYETGEQMGEATSQWVVFNLTTRKMARIPNSVLEDFKYQALERQVMEEGYTADKLPDVSDVGSVCTAPMTHYVRRNDMDMNGHVNNVVYVQWLLESVPPETWNGRALKEIILEYRSECNFGENVTATCCELNNGRGDSYVLLHKLARGADEIVRAKTVWTK